MEIELYHYGIKGMKWGDRNGPPYPLGYKHKSTNEKQADKFWTKERKNTLAKIAKGAAITATIALAIYGGYKLSQMDRTKTILGKDLVQKSLSKHGNEALPRVGKTLEMIDTKMVADINKNNIGRSGEINCAHTSMAYILNSVFGQHVQAQGFSGIDEQSGLVRQGRNKRIFDMAFNGIEHIKIVNDLSFSENAKRIKPGSTGILYVNGFGHGHFINYEKSSTGRLLLVDSQQRDARTRFLEEGGRAYQWFANNYKIMDIMDFSAATISENADSIFKNCIL